MLDPVPRILRLPALVALTLCSWACAPPVERPELAPPFSFAILADPHLTSNPEREARLTKLVDWINAETPARRLELVLVLGDLGWEEGLEKAPALLGRLGVPWVPIIGDNEVVFGSEEAFDRIFAPQYAALAKVLPDFQRAARPVRLVQPDRDAWLQNLAFSWRGVRFVGLDWASRQEGVLASEVGNLHDVAGGSLPWLTGEIAHHPDATGFVLLSHLPMHSGAFTAPEMERLAAALEPRRADVLADVAGHVHLNYESSESGWEVWVTAATWSSEQAIRIVRVTSQADGARLTQELVTVPY
jgi:hypothetical protein